MKKHLRIIGLCSLVLFALTPLSAQQITEMLSGSKLIEQAAKLTPKVRESFIEERILAGNYPSFMNSFVRVDVQTVDATGKVVKGYYFVAPDYLSIGTDTDFVRMPMQPTTAQRIAISMGCFLSTKKICDDVYKAADVKLEPRPLTKDRDSLYTFVEHNKLIEEQRAGRTGLIAGHKKDVIITHKLIESGRDDRVALYGWHKLDGNAIQPIYTGHVDWYVDYSHGMRLVQQTIYVDGKPMNYVDVMKHPVYSRLICDEDACDYYAYPTKGATGPTPKP